MSMNIKMVGDVIFDTKNNMTVRVMYYDEDRLMVTRSILTGKYFVTDLSAMNSDACNSRFITLESLFINTPMGWNFPTYPNDPLYTKDNLISVYLNSYRVNSPNITNLILCNWDDSEGCPIRDGNLYMRMCESGTKLIIPLSEISDSEENTRVFIGGQSIEMYRNSNKMLFAQSNVLSHSWKKGLLITGTNVKHIEYRWSSDCKIDIRDDGGVYVFEYDIEDFCGTCPKHSLIFDDKYVKKDGSKNEK